LARFARQGFLPLGADCATSAALRLRVNLFLILHRRQVVCTKRNILSRIFPGKLASVTLLR